MHHVPALARSLVVFACSLVLIVAIPSSTSAAPVAEETDLMFFENEVRPLLAKRCTKCHGEKKQKSELRLDSLAAMLTGGTRGPAVIPGDPDGSPLIRAVRQVDDDLEMPPLGELDEAEIEVLVRWVRDGASAPGGGDAVAAFDLVERKKHWAFLPLGAAAPPTVKDESWAEGPLDRFVLAGLEEQGLAPAPPASRRDWIRRATFDLTGLPPTPDEVEAFVADTATDARARVVDRLLDSPRYAERWARHWLDLVGYAETRGHEFDYILPNAWEYRDWVIRAFDADLPYDRFLTEQIAGDLVDPPRLHPTEGWNESLLGTGFWSFGEEVHSPVSTRGERMNRVTGRIDSLTRGFLGLSVACARCHDHKFDAITAKDFYALAGFAEGATYTQVRYETHEDDRRIGAALDTLDRGARSASTRAGADRFASAPGTIADAIRVAREVREKEQWQRGIEHLAHGPIAPHSWLLTLRENARAELATRAEGSGLDARALAAWVDAVDALPGQVTVDVGDAPGTVLLDWRNAASQRLVQNGGAFGARVVGDVALGDEADHPARRAFPIGGVRFDPAWRVVRRDGASEGDPGGVNWTQAGVTVKTPSFDLTTGWLWYLVEGAGQAYAAVDKHRMVHGPLHQQIVTRFGDSDELRWIRHDLSMYVGHRVHVEFSPSLGSRGRDFAVAMIVETAGPDAPPLRRVDTGLRGEPTDAAARFGEAFEAFGAGRATPVQLAIVDWWLRRPGLASGGAPAVGEVARLIEARHALVAEIEPESKLALAVLDGSGVDEQLLNRGDILTPTGPVARRFLEAIDGPEPLVSGVGSGRLALAARMTSPDDPLPARVLVNRVWHHLFGRGLVASVDDFGKMGEEPTHPALLDWLARRFVADGWSVKAVIREVALSSTYAMSSDASDAAVAADPANRLWHHVPIRRLSAEAIRDAILAVSGGLDPAMYGPPVPIHLTTFMEGRGRPGRSGPLDGSSRRSVYLSVRRNFLSPFLQAFDLPSPAQTMGRRGVSNVPAQALALMNDPFVVEQAERWAGSVRASSDDPDAIVDTLYRRAFARPPTDEEARQARAFLDESDDGRGLSDLCHVLFNVKEFVFLR